MKKMRFITVLLTLFVAVQALAVPAKPGVFSYTQPDGSIVKLELHGDEFLSWYTLAGTNQVVRLDTQGYWQPSSVTPAMRREANERRREVYAQQRSFRPSVHKDNPVTHGTHHIPVILVQFKDVKFSLDGVKDRFTRMLNAPDYADDGATGSVAQYYSDNSHGAYDPIFDVYGPVTVPENLAYYGEQVQKANGTVIHDRQPEMALYHACLQLDASVDFSPYDADKDGYVDMILFYYAGYSQAEHAPSDAIWPHKHSVKSSSHPEAKNATFDGVKLADYFCTAELRGKEGTRMCGIGVTAHEFGHSLGLPDFYDTDYDENGRCAALGKFSIMSSGSYNDDSRTPPYYNAEERIYLGWMTESDLLPLPEGRVSFGSVQNDVAYYSPTTTEGEYFLYEFRDGTGWDRSIPKGLVVYHVDKSTVRKLGSYSPYNHWANWKKYNAINAYGDHPCFYVVPAGAQSDLNFKGEVEEWVFPGSSRTTQFTPVDWEGSNLLGKLSSISYSQGQINFNFTKGLVDKYFGLIGLCAIEDPGCGQYTAGEAFPLKLTVPQGQSTRTVHWFYDGKEETDASVTLTAGDHRVSAVVEWTDNSTETLELLIHVQ